jgi:aminomethyltransferase
MKTTAFNKFHKELGGKMTEFAGYEMPVEYTGVTEEHINVRKNVGVFDVSHMGEFWVKGPKAFDLVQRITTNDVSKLTPGKIQYTCMPNGKGGIVDDLLVYHYEENKYLLVVNAANIEKDWKWVNEQNTMDAELENGSDHTAQIAVQGPNTTQVLQKITDINLDEIKYYTFVTGPMAGIDEVIISATGYTGSGGFELYVYNDDAPKLWEAVFEAGKEFNIMPAGLAARDTLRLEAGLALYGNDIDDSTSPIEAGLGWITKFTEGNDFIDREKLEKQKAEGPEKRLRGFIMKERGIPRKDYEIADSEENIIGRVTSGTMSPMLKQGIGMGYVKSGMHKTGTEIFIKVRKKLLKAELVKLPFYKA